MFVNILADQREVRPQLLVDCGVLLCPVATQRPHAVSVPERVSVAAAPCDWRDANWSQRRVRRSVRACVGARVSFPDTGNSYESGVCVCLQRPGKVRKFLQKCGQAAAAAAAAAETTSQDPLPLPRPQLPSDAEEPPKKVCKLPAGAARTPGHLGGGRASALGLAL